MKLQCDNRRTGRLLGMGLAAAMMISCSMCSLAVRLSGVRESGAAITANRIAALQSGDGESLGTLPVPFVRTSGLNAKDSSKKLNDVYDKLVQSEQQKKQAAEQSSSTATVTETLPVDTTLSEQATTSTTQTTTTTVRSSAETVSTRPTQEEPAVSNGKQPFNFHDVSSIAPEMGQLADFVENLNPTSFSWDTSDYERKGYVKISLASSNGSVTLEVKPSEQPEEIIAPYTIDGEMTGSMNVTSLESMDWYKRNKNGGACICSVTWLRPEFTIAPVRGLGVGTGLADLTGGYLCVNGGGTTLYKASDVIQDENKLNELLASENAYTFVGGRLYTIDGYLDKYYNGTQSTYQFEDCDMVVQYGCNSVMDHNYTTGTWIIEYAIKNDVVVGITFMNKSYYKNNDVHGGATSSSTSSTESKSDTEETATSAVGATTSATTVQPESSAEKTALTDTAQKMESTTRQTEETRLGSGTRTSAHPEKTGETSGTVVGSAGTTAADQADDSSSEAGL